MIPFEANHFIRIISAAIFLNLFFIILKKKIHLRRLSHTPIVTSNLLLEIKSIFKKQWAPEEFDKLLMYSFRMSNLFLGFFSTYLLSSLTNNSSDKVLLLVLIFYTADWSFSFYIEHCENNKNFILNRVSEKYPKILEASCLVMFAAYFFNGELIREDFLIIKEPLLALIFLIFIFGQFESGWLTSLPQKVYGSKPLRTESLSIFFNKLVDYQKLFIGILLFRVLFLRDNLQLSIVDNPYQFGSLVFFDWGVFTVLLLFIFVTYSLISKYKINNYVQFLNSLCVPMIYVIFFVRLISKI